MASFPGLCKAVGPAEEEENGELDGSLQQMLKAIADERNRLNIRQEISGLGESIRPLVIHRGPNTVCRFLGEHYTITFMYKYTQQPV